MAQAQLPATPDLMRQVTASARELYIQRLDPLADRLLFSIPLLTTERQAMPMVLVLGNHSAGKSTFINFLLGREVQKTGVAPTDDGFTVISGGSQDEERDGAAVIGTPSLGLGELQRFGPNLVSHLQLKVRSSCEILNHLWLVDSPGMIDAAYEDNNRGYEFFDVVRWLAERADIILLLFDPDKPGTTGETLKALTQSLAMMDHKLLIVMNKADQFSSIQDFARAYGALCWNLSKVIHRKDLPRIHTCYIPGPGRPAGDGTVPADDFEIGRQELVAEVRKAPDRRIDNVVTSLYEDTRELLIHARVCEAVRQEFQRALWRNRFAAMSVGLVFILTAVVLKLHGAGLPQQLFLIALALGATGLLLPVARQVARRQTMNVVKDLDDVFHRVYRRHLEVADRGDLREIWKQLRERVQKAISTIGPDQLGRVSPREIRGLEEILNRRVPEMRSSIHAVRNNTAIVTGA